MTTAILGISLDPLTLAKDLVSALLSAGLLAFGAGAAELVRALLGFVTSTSDPVLSGGWWSASGQAVFDRVTVVAASLLALAFMWSIITAVLSGDHGLLARACKRLPLAVIETALLVAVAGALVAATDEVSLEIARGSTGTLSTFAATSMAGAVSGTGVVGFLGAGLVILAGFVVWAELLCRTALIYVAVMAGPLVFAASVHPSLAGLQRRYIEGSLALICSKVVVALAFATGSALLSSTGALTSFSSEVGALLEALTVLLVACFAPFVLLRLLLGAEAIVVAEGLERRPARAALAQVSTVSSIGAFTRMAQGLGHVAPGGPASGAPGAPPPAPPTPPAPSGPAGNGSGPSGNGGSRGRATPARPTPPASPASPLTGLGGSR